jgi:hypothetical protein
MRERLQGNTKLFGDVQAIVQGGIDRAMNVQTVSSAAIADGTMTKIRNSLLKRGVD